LSRSGLGDAVRGAWGILVRLGSWPFYIKKFRRLNETDDKAMKDHNRMSPWQQRFYRGLYYPLIRTMGNGAQLIRGTTVFLATPVAWTLRFGIKSVSSILTLIYARATTQSYSDVDIADVNNPHRPAASWNTSKRWTEYKRTLFHSNSGRKNNEHDYEIIKKDESNSDLLLSESENFQPDVF